MLPAGLAIVGVSAKALAAMDSARLPRTFFDFADMHRTYAAKAHQLKLLALQNLQELTRP
jgi:alanine-glyoxylate transaminase/serine-glyoxylate transaminase/serine-pyruvate transaminase